MQVARSGLVGDIWQSQPESKRERTEEDLGWSLRGGSEKWRRSVRRETSGNQILLHSKLAVTALQKIFYPHFSLIIGLLKKHLKEEECCFLLNLYLKNTKIRIFFSRLTSTYTFIILP